MESRTATSPRGGGRPISNGQQRDLLAGAAGPARNGLHRSQQLHGGPGLEQPRLDSQAQVAVQLLRRHRSGRENDGQGPAGARSLLTHSTGPKIFGMFRSVISRQERVGKPRHRGLG